MAGLCSLRATGSSVFVVFVTVIGIRAAGSADINRNLVIFDVLFDLARVKHLIDLYRDLAPALAVSAIGARD